MKTLSHTHFMAANHPDHTPARTKVTLSILHLLLSNGAKINAQDNRGMTALIDASSWGNLPVVQLLLRNGANAALHNQRGSTALKMANARWKRIQGKRNALHEQQQIQGIIKLLKQAVAKE